MEPVGKSLFASVLLHVAAVIAAAVFVVHPPIGPGTEGETDEPWGLFSTADASSEIAGSASTDDSTVALPPEPAANPQPAPGPSPSLPTVEAASAPLDLVTTNAPSSPPAIDLPATIAKKSSRKTSQTSATSRNAGTLSAGNGDGAAAAYSPARYARCPPPVFPAEARKAKISGTVLLLVQVDENGRPVEVTVRHSSGHDILDSTATRAVRTWRFVPARLSGRPVNARLEIPVRFATSS